MVGAGLAGARTAYELRAQGFSGEVVLLGAEEHRPYDRPPLSKGLLAGLVDDTTLDVDLTDVDLRLGVRATGLRDGVLETDQGELAYDALVLATGATPVRLGDGLVVRTVDDARALRAQLVPGAHVVVVGAGWIGAEVATTAAARGCRVTVLEADEAPLGALGEVGRFTLPWYEALGIEVRLRTPALHVGAHEVVTTDGTLTADVVVVGVGARPDTDWLAGSHVPVDRGVLVDRHLQSVPGVVAVGDCAAWESGLFGTRLRVEHWDDALRAPTVAAATLLARPGVAADDRPVHDPVPYFWSEQLGHRLQHCGHAEGADQLVHRGSPDDPSWSVCWLRGGRLVAVLAVDAPRDLAQGRKLIAARACPDPSKLADPSLPLRSAGSPVQECLG